MFIFSRKHCRLWKTLYVGWQPKAALWQKNSEAYGPCRVASAAHGVVTDWRIDLVTDEWTPESVMR